MKLQVKLQQKYNTLIQKITKWNYEYYNLDNPSVDDAVYDKAIQELIELEKKYPELIKPNSPTMRVGGEVVKKFEKHVHEKQMLSLSNAFNKNDLIQFEKQIKKLLNSEEKIDYVLELKIDGISISLLYENGKLIKGVTRGDGITGEVITSNVKTISDVPLIIPYKKNLEVRGEIYLTHSQFDLINKERLKASENLFANPRNAAAGTMRQLDSTIAKKRKLKMFSYFWMNEDIKTHEEGLIKLKTNGFVTNSKTKITNDIEEVWNYCQKILVEREKLDYEIDGVVIKVNNVSFYKKLGFTSKFPKWAIAFKFPAELAQTKLIDIVPTIGRTGRITYNARLKPVKIAGTIISNATLHNSDYIKGLDIRIGDIVEIKKAGDIIPKVIGVKKSSRKKVLPKWQEAEICPVCQSKLLRFDDEIDQYCNNPNCHARLVQSLSHYCSRKALNIEGLGEAIIEKLINLKIVNSILDIYKLENKKNKIIELEGFGNRSFENLINSINNSKKQSLEKFLFALGIRYIGEKSSKQIAKLYRNIETLKNIKYEDIISNFDIGPKIAKSIVLFFSNQKNLELLDKLKKFGVNFEYKGSSIKSNPFKGKKIVITGTLSMSRDIMKEYLEKLGIDVITSLSNKTDYLLVGENPGGKLEKAKKLKIKILKEKDILVLFN